MCDNDECDPIVPGKITPKPLPEQANGGAEVVSALPSVDDAEKGVTYVYFTDVSDVSTFQGAYILNEDANQLVNISSEGGGSGGGLTELTTNDYNWNSTAGDSTTEPFDCIALWLLKPGQYCWKNNVLFKLLKNWSPNPNSGQAVIWDAGINGSGDAMTGVYATYAQNHGQIRLINSSTGGQVWGNFYLLSTAVYGGGDFRKICIGNAYYGPDDAIAIGTDAYIPKTTDTDAIVIGHAAKTRKDSIALGKGAAVYQPSNIAIGEEAKATGNSENDTFSSIAFGRKAMVSNAQNGLALGSWTECKASYSVALGTGSVVTQQGQVDISLSKTGIENKGYNNSSYRLLTGLYDGQSAHDAATVGQITPTTDSSAPTTATAGRLGEIRIDTTTNTAYMCVVSDSDTPAYEWKQITA